MIMNSERDRQADKGETETGWGVGRCGLRARGPSATRERRADDAGAAVLKTAVLCGEPYGIGRAESVKPVKGQKGRCWAWGNREATAHLAVVELRRGAVSMQRREPSRSRLERVKLFAKSRVP